MAAIDLRGAYVRAVQVPREALTGTRAMARLDDWADRSRNGKWVRSLLAVYDLQDLAALDTPWWTFDASARVAAFLQGRRNARVLEWGSGSSTLWLSRRCAQVTSIEHDPQWAEEVEAIAPGNAAILLRPARPATSDSPVIRSHKAGFEGLDFTDYVAAVDAVAGDFDLIVVDGRAREACLVRAVERLSPGGLVVFDNVDRARYRAAIAGLGDRVSVVWTRGLTPCLPYPTRTALISVAAPAG